MIPGAILFSLLIAACLFEVIYAIRSVRRNRQFRKEIEAMEAALNLKLEYLHSTLITLEEQLKQEVNDG